MCRVASGLGSKLNMEAPTSAVPLGTKFGSRGSLSQQHQGIKVMATALSQWGAGHERYIPLMRVRLLSDCPMHSQQVTQCLHTPPRGRK